MISLFDILKKNGISVGERMKPEDMISVLSSVPSILSNFPEVSSAVNTLQSILNTFNTAKDTLQQAISFVEYAEKKLKKAQQYYDEQLSTVPGMYTAPPLGGPVLPSASSGQYSTLKSAYQVLEQAKEQLQKAQDNVNKIENQLKDKVSSIVKLVFTSKV